MLPLYIDNEEFFEILFDNSQLKLYDVKESTIGLPNKNNLVSKIFEDQQTKHIFHHPIAIYME